MKISTEEVGRIIQTQRLNRIALKKDRILDRRTSRPEAGATPVEVSDEAQEVQRVKKLVDSAPDVREEMVQALKAKIESGTYNVSGEDIADLMVRRTFADNVR